MFDGGYTLNSASLWTFVTNILNINLIKPLLADCDLLLLLLFMLFIMDNQAHLKLLFPPQLSQSKTFDIFIDRTSTY